MTATSERTGDPAAAADLSSLVVDEAVDAAAGTRSAARWMASALGGIPSLAILGSIVRAPGDVGFDALELALGVALAALGAIVGVLGFARVIAPVPLEDDDVRGIDLARVPGQPYATFDELDEHIAAAYVSATQSEGQLDQSSAKSLAAQVEALCAEDYALLLEREAARASAGADLVARAERVREEAESKRRAATVTEITTAGDRDSLAVWTIQLARAHAIRRDAYRLTAADEVGRRYLHARIAAAVAVGLIAAGVVLLGLAPKTRPVPSPIGAASLSVADRWSSSTSSAASVTTTLRAARSSTKRHTRDPQSARPAARCGPGRVVVAVRQRTTPRRAGAPGLGSGRGSGQPCS